MDEAGDTILREETGDTSLRKETEDTRVREYTGDASLGKWTGDTRRCGEAGSWGVSLTVRAFVLEMRLTSGQRFLTAVGRLWVQPSATNHIL